MKRQLSFPLLCTVALAITLPYILAALIGGGERVFIGFLLNPADGASYLAKMYQGWAGAWRFTLPFTAEPGNGAYLFLYYLFLGHLARWLSLPLIGIYHLARLVGAALLLLALCNFFGIIFAGKPGLYRLACWLAAVGSGMGWLVVFTGLIPTDFWVAEAYPFLAMFANPHFPLGLALLLDAFTLLLDPAARFRSPRLLLDGLLIAIILPFGVVVALVVAAAWAAWTWIETRKLEWLPVVSLGLLGGPFLLYQFWAAQTDPALAVWNAQNLTPSPYVWDFLLSFSPALLLAPFGLLRLYRERENPARRLLIAWFALGLLLIYLPTSLQRRFMLGFYLPAAALAVYGIDFLRAKAARPLRWLSPALFALALPTNLLLILIGLSGALTHSPMLYITQDEARALAWIQAKTPARSLVLAAPDTGRLIPAFTGRRVIYGHPFETLHAAQEEARVGAFFAGQGKVDPSADLLGGVDYLFYGPREQLLKGKLDLSALPVVFTSGAVRIYSIPKAP